MRLHNTGWIVWIAERTAEQIDTSRKNGGCIRFTWKPTRIIKSQRCFERGRFAPLTCTSSSTLVVNRVLVSQYTDILASAAIRSIVPWLFIPLRFVYISIPLQIYTALVYNVPNWHDDITRCWEMLNIKDALGWYVIRDMQSIHPWFVVDYGSRHWPRFPWCKCLLALKYFLCLVPCPRVNSKMW